MHKMKKTIQLLAFFLAAGAAARAQVAPAATSGPASLHYSLRYSETADFFGGTEGDQQRGIASGSVDYANGGEHFPLTLNYTGGYIAVFSGPNADAGYFQNFLISQGYIGSKWNIVFSDNVSYLPQSATVGFSGVPGSGEPVGGGTGAPPDSNQPILTLNTRTLNNIGTGEITRSINSSMRFSAGGNTELIAYPDGGGVDTTIQMANLELTRRLNARNSISGQYLFDQYSYSSSPVTFDTNTASANYSRTWSRQLKTSVSAGPQLTHSSDTSVIPDTTGLYVNASANDRLRFGTATMTYTHGKSSGGGALIGGNEDFVNGGLSREFSRKLEVGVQGSYRHTAGAASSGIITAAYGGVEATWRLNDDFTVFANYTAINQSTSAVLQSNVLNQFEQVVGFGIGYTPRRTHLIRP
jgi:hypothetical protein